MPEQEPERFVAYVERSLEDLVPGYLENRRTDVDTIREAMRSQDFSTARTVGHGMKGSGGGYGFDHITAYGASIERDAENEDADGVLAATVDLERYLSDVRIVLVDDE